VTIPRFDDEDLIPSPCISICKMDPAAGSAEDRAAGGLCVGCLRTLDEIVEWGMASNARRHAILERVGRRSST
jgi:predicted Fe-S protein YdhL (DUF1289 family)